ncbi:TetR/AcrR family transcriptional regulator [Mycolicibacterium alvei]|uniref:TetR/AcrR family transcriptional regulator n=1 Tax=Mycolicibacterium alvei TaxID=67081 RepID=UPI001F461B02|nr:TetR/AcrR family transcriptional regulator [Mycolicibacterium alvei]
MGGGNTAEQAREVLMDAAEYLFVTRGYRASTMEVIAHEAGYSRTAIYRQFTNRDDLIAAIVQRTTQRHMGSILPRIPDGAGPIALLVESLVIVATELVSDPLLNTIADQTPEGTIASLIAGDSDLTELVTTTIEGIIAEDAGQFRSGLDPHDLAQFIIATALGFLVRAVPGITEPDAARRYIETFVLPAIVKKPPPPCRVF